MYQLTIGQRRRHVRDDLATPLAIDPALIPAEEALPEAVTEVVSNVEAVAPQTKRYRATVTRTITESCVVEFDALETENLWQIAEALVPQVPADAWIDNPTESYGYIDRIEEVEPAAASEPGVGETLNDDLPLDDEDEITAPETAGRKARARLGRRHAPRRARRRQVRETADDVNTILFEIQSEAEQIVNTTPASAAEAADDVAALEALISEAEALASAEIADSETASASDARLQLQDMVTALEQLIVAQRELEAELADQEAEPSAA